MMFSGFCNTRDAVYEGGCVDIMRLTGIKSLRKMCNL